MGAEPSLRGMIPVTCLPSSSRNAGAAEASVTVEVAVRLPCYSDLDGPGHCIVGACTLIWSG